MSPTNTWTPILSGSSAATAMAAVEEVLLRAGEIESSVNDPGLSLLNLYWGRLHSNDTYIDVALRRAEAWQDSASTDAYAWGLYGGIAGLAWLLTHLAAGRDDTLDDALAECDRALVDLCRPTRRIPYDLVSGTTGLAVYFAERLPRPIGHRGCEAVTHVLSLTSEPMASGIAWRTDPSHLPQWQRALASNGYYNLGVAHGAPGVIGALSASILRGFQDPKAEALVRDAAAWVISSASGEGGLQSWISAEGPRQPSRLAWCYGSLGASVSLVLAGHALRDTDLTLSGVALALECAKRVGDVSVIDASLCHGAAGNAHLFSRLYHATRRVEFKEAAQFWFERTLALRVPGAGIAGFQTWVSVSETGQPKMEWKSDPTFLMGATGTALALLAACTDQTPNWDSLLCASLPLTEQ